MVARKGKACEKNLFKNVFIEINLIAEIFFERKVSQKYECNIPISESDRV